MRSYIVAISLLALTAPAVQASSDDAWAEFGKAVSTACVKAAAGQIEKPRAVVDPYGSDHFGLALVTGKAKGAKQTISLICVYDKQTKTVELGSEFSADQVKVTPGR
ncbi:hypothetical protein ACQKGC_24300 [Allorhizobium pseudoryzae]|uniref:hypothetical protein n=1 Tax=Allorhizobium pseudoryzae TaxID=379684 RepID=UPI003D031155